jgi:hypothetical protein
MPEEKEWKEERGESEDSSVLVAKGEEKKVLGRGQSPQCQMLGHNSKTVFHDHVENSLLLERRRRSKFFFG